MKSWKPVTRIKMGKLISTNLSIPWQVAENRGR